MLAYKSLEHVDFEVVHSAFIDAFSNYEVPFELTVQELSYMLERRGYATRFSYGAFYNNQLVGFVLNAVVDVKGLLTAYDTGTGIVQEFQGKGVAKKLLNFTIEKLKNQGVQQYQLEVIKTNQKAFQLYKSLRFQISNDYDFYVFSKSKLLNKGSKSIPNVSFEETNLPKWEEAENFLSIDPSWQNSIASIERKRSHFITLSVLFKEEFIGYGIIERHTGDIPQMVIHPNYRRKGIGSKLMGELVRLSTSEKIKMINIKSNYRPFKQFFNAFQIPSGKGQYEMTLKF